MLRDDDSVAELKDSRLTRCLFRSFSVAGIALLTVVSSWASIYAYTDAQGRIRITDIPDGGHEVVLPRNAPAKKASRTAYSGSRTATRRSPDQFRTIVKEAARKHRLSESLIFAVMRAESGFNPDACSPAGAQGLMQLIPSTARFCGVQNSFNPAQNVDGGAKYLRMMLDRFGRVDLALAAYNAGPEAVEKHGGIPPYRETRDYVPRVMKFYREFGGAGELNLTRATVPFTSSSRTRTASRRSSGSRGLSAGATTLAQAKPVFYYRGPDGQIYIGNR